MNPSKDVLPYEKLIDLFFLFIVGTICFFIYNFSSVPVIGWSQVLRLAIYFFGIFSYEFVILSLIIYYISRAKEKFVEFYQKNKKKFVIYFIITLGLTYILLDLIIAKSWLIFFRDLVMIILIIIAIPPISNLVNKVYNKWQQKNETNK
ncbi:MAG: hypothetical protein ABIE94_03265 [archaeon]